MKSGCSDCSVASSSSQMPGPNVRTDFDGHAGKREN